LLAGVKDEEFFPYSVTALVAFGGEGHRHIIAAEKLVLPQEKMRSRICLRFVARPAHRVNVRNAGKSAVDHKCFTWRPIFAAGSEVDDAGRAAHRA
jgi:hypothetical protein